jgi:hypothetical protein
VRYTKVTGVKRREDELYRYLTGLADYEEGNVSSRSIRSGPYSGGEHVLMLVIDVQCLNGATHLELLPQF